MREGILAAGAPLADVEGTEDAGAAFAFGLAGLSLAQSSEILVPGTATSYKTTVTNRSSRFLNGVRVSLTFDPRLTSVRITCSSGNQNASCCENDCRVDPGGDTLVDDQVVLPPGADVTYLLEATVPPWVRGDARNEVSVRGPDGVVDPVPDDNLLFKPLPVNPRADLTVDLEAEVVDGGPAIAGQSKILYTITATNQGPSDATRVVVTVDLPGDLKLLSSDPSQGTVQTQAGGQKILWNVRRLTGTPGAAPKATSSTLGIETEVLARARGSLTTRTSIDGAEPDPSQEPDSVKVTVETRSDLRVDLHFHSEPIAGQELRSTLGATNLGSSDAVGVVNTFLLPEGVELVSPKPNGVISFDGTTRTLQWRVGSLPAAAGRNSVSREVVTRVISSRRGVLEHTARVEFPSSETDKDPDLRNNSVSPDPQVKAVATLSLDGSAAPSPVVAGKEKGLPYVVKVCNVDGPSDATDVEVKIPVPEGMVFVSAQPSAGIFPFPPGSDVWSVGTLEPHDCATIDVTLTVLPARRDQHDWELEATANEAPRVTKPLSTRVIGQADLTLSIAVSPSPAVAGGKLIYKIKLENAGPSDATEAVVTVTFPNGIELPDEPAGRCGDRPTNGQVDGGYSAPESGPCGDRDPRACDRRPESASARLYSLRGGQRARAGRAGARPSRRTEHEKRNPRNTRRRPEGASRARRKSRDGPARRKRLL